MSILTTLFFIFLISPPALANVVFRLEKSFPAKHSISLLRAFDDSRLGPQIVAIPLQNDSFPQGLYHAKVLLGSPAKEFSVKIDTGSDALWVSCKACDGCYQNTNYYDESVSSTSYLISCSDEICSRAPHTCSIIDHQDMCTYTLPYSSTNEASGYYVSDVLHLVINGTSNAPPTVVFGCTTSVAQRQERLDGVFGFGRQSLSVINQLYTQGAVPHVFSHCLALTSGGVLAIGYPHEPEMVYTPLVPDVINFDITLKNISVNGQTLPISQSTFKQGITRIDSGIALAYLARGAYLYLLDAINKAVPDHIQPTIIDGIQCYRSNLSVAGLFPGVTLNFADNASMVLGQGDYLIQQHSEVDFEVWCIGIMESTNEDTILGDLLLRDKLVVYDLEHQRIGWADYDCPSYINATTTAPSSGVRSEPEILLTILAIILVGPWILM